MLHQLYPTPACAYDVFFTDSGLSCCACIHMHTESRQPNFLLAVYVADPLLHLALPPQVAPPTHLHTAQTPLNPHTLCLCIPMHAILLSMHHGTHTPRRRSWLSQLNIEDSGVGFSSFAWSSNSPPQADAAPHYRFLRPTSPESFLHIKLEGMGPKLLVSDASTADQPVLRWRLVVRGNTAVEFGVVPLCLVVSERARHACGDDAGGDDMGGRGCARP